MANLSEAGLRYALPPRAQWVRRLAARPLNLLPYTAYSQLVKLIKRNRKHTAFTMPEAVDGGGGTAYVWLTQDIDTADCWDYLPEVLAIQERMGIRSTSHFLTRGPYRIQPAFLADMRARGFEVGLHGDWHDAAIGFRSTQQITRRLKQAMAVLGENITSYRAPALGISERLLSVLHILGFTVDSSIPVSLFYKNGVSITRPYRYPSIGIVEAPLALQDVNIMVDMPLEKSQIEILFTRLLSHVARENGVLVFNAHPVHIHRRLPEYEALLKFLQAQPDVVFLNNSTAVVALVI